MSGLLNIKVWFEVQGTEDCNDIVYKTGNTSSSEHLIDLAKLYEIK